MSGLSRVVSRSLPLLLSAAFPAASFAVQTGVAAQAEMAGPAPADTLVVAVQDTSKVVPGARYENGPVTLWPRSRTIVSMSIALSRGMDKASATRPSLPRVVGHRA